MASEAAETLTNALLDAVKFGNAEAVRRLLEAAMSTRFHAGGGQGGFGGYISDRGA